MISQFDMGAGYVGQYTIPANTNRFVAYMNGPGAGGGAGDGQSAGGGGGAGAKGMFVFTGDLGGMVLDISIAVGGLGGIAPGGNGKLAINHTTVTFANGFQLIAGGGAVGYGGAGANAGPGGRGGNIATNTGDQGGSATIPTEVTSFGQFNLGAAAGMDGTVRLWGHGGNEGDTGGGGKGGWINTNGLDGQGGYAHFEAY